MPEGRLRGRRSRWRGESTGAAWPLSYGEFEGFGLVLCAWLITAETRAHGKRFFRKFVELRAGVADTALKRLVGVGDARPFHFGLAQPVAQVFQLAGGGLELVDAVLQLSPLPLPLATLPVGLRGRSLELVDAVVELRARLLPGFLVDRVDLDRVSRLGTERIDGRLE